MSESVDLGYAVKLPSHRAIEYFRSKGYVMTWDWKESLAESNAKAFTVAKATKMEVLRTIRDEVDKAISEGVTFHTFRAQLQPKLQKLGWWGKRVMEAPDGTAELVQLGSVGRLKTIFRTNLSTAYKEQLKRAESKLRPTPYWQYIAVLDARTRPAHRNLHGKVFHYTDPFWDTFYPPNGWNCRCRVRALTKQQVKSRGIKVEKGEGQLEKFTQKIGVDKYTGKVLTQQATRFRGKNTAGQKFAEAPDIGFGYNPGSNWPRWDKRGISPETLSEQASSGDAGIAIIEPDQKTYEDYGLPSVKDYAASLLEQAPTVLTGATSLNEALKIFDEMLLERKELKRINTPLESVIIHRQHIRHILLKRDQQREKFINYIIPTLTSPNEIWLTGYSDGFRRRFIKIFERKKNMLIVVRENQDGSLFWNAIPTSRIDYIDVKRKGVLLYKK